MTNRSRTTARPAVPISRRRAGAPGEIDDRQAAMTEANIALGVDPLPVGAPVGQDGL